MHVLHAQSFASSSRDFAGVAGVNEGLSHLLKNVLAGLPYHPDIVIMYVMLLLSGKFVKHLRPDSSSKKSNADVVLDYLKVTKGECVPRDPHSHGDCLSEKEARDNMWNKLMSSLNSMTIVATQVMTQTRIQYFLENDDDFIMFFCDKAEKIWTKLKPIFANLVLPTAKNAVKFWSLLKQRHESGRGSPDSLVRAADAVFKGLKSLEEAYNDNHQVRRLLKKLWGNVVIFGTKFGLNYDRIFSAYEDGSVHEDVDKRLWDVIGADTSVGLLLKAESVSKGEVSSEVRGLLKDLLKNLEAGKFEAVKTMADQSMLTPRRTESLLEALQRFPSMGLQSGSSVFPEPMTMSREQEDYMNVIRGWVRDIRRG